MIAMPNLTRRKYLFLVLAILSISLTEFYGIAYLILLVYAAWNIHLSYTLSSFFGRIILFSLLFSSLIMLLGLLLWIVGIQIYPIIIASSVLILIHLFIREGVRSHPKKIIDGGDMISLLLGLSAPGLIFISFILPNPTQLAVYQFISNGWDNGSHIVMLQTAATERGYVYGPDDEVIGKTIGHSGAYPQAWHLVTSHVMNGFGVNLFNPKNPLVSMNAYLFALFGWYVIAVYGFSRIAWRLLESLLTDQAIKSWLLIISLFIVSNLLIQLSAFWGALTTGFANYIGGISYGLIMSALIIDKSNKLKPENTALAAVLLGAASVLSWFLVFPAIISMLVIGLWKRNLVKFSSLIKFNKLMVTVVIALSAIVIQVAVFILYSEVSTAEQLNNGEIGFAFRGGELLVAFVIGSSLYYWIRNRSNIENIRNKSVAIISSFMVLTLLIYLYQVSSSGETSYYFGKLMKLALIYAGVFFVPAFVYMFIVLKNRYDIFSLNIIIASLSIMGVALVASNQSIAGFNGLLQKNSNVSPPVANQIIEYLRYNDLDQVKLVTLRHKSATEDYNANPAAKVAHLPYTCAYEVITRKSVSSIERKIENLDRCAASIGKDILVLTSNLTDEKVKELKRNNIKTVRIP